jgi:hypothetical protein
VLLIAPAGATAEELRLPPPGTAEWGELTFRGIRRTTSYTPVEGASPGVRAESRCSASGMFLPLREVDLSQTPILAWRWRIEQGLEVSDERSPEGDDFAARVYVLFAFEPERATWTERIRHRFGSLVYDPDPPGSAIDFAWASHAPVGESWKSPRAPTSRMVVQASGPAEGWREEQADIPAWYTRLFGHPPPELLALALMTDSDDTCQRAVALYADFRFLPRDP